MNGRNNLGQQYTSNPHFGKTYPNTQYKGYQDHEGTPFGTASAGHPVAPVNQYGYTSQYQGQNPYHQEERFSNVQAHGRGQSDPMPMGRSQYQGTQPVSPYRGTGHTSASWGTGGASYYPAQPQGMSGAGYGTPSPSHEMGVSRYEPSSMRNPGSHTYGTTPGQGVDHPIAYPTPQNQETAGLYQSMIDNPEMESSFRNGTPAGATQSAGSAGAAAEALTSAQVRTGTQFNDRDRIQDLLSAEKYLTEGYNISTFEATNPELHNTLQSILNDTHEHRETLYRTMEQRGWYKTEPADQQTVSQAYHQFTNYRQQLPF